jgi:multidrug efflux pump subunit AcrB
MKLIHSGNDELVRDRRRAFDPRTMVRASVGGALLLTCVGIGVGCGPRVQPITRITISCPGLTPVESDELVALPLINAISGVPRIADRIGFSRQGRVEIYVTWEATEDQASLASNLSFVANLLPPETGRPELTSVLGSSGIPIPEPGDEQVITIHFDRDKLAALGVSYTTAANAARDHLSAPVGDIAAAMQRLQSLSVSADGREIPFQDVAKVGIETQPKCVVRR